VGWKCVAGYPFLLARFSTRDAGHYHISEMPNLRGLSFLAFQHFLPERRIFLIVAALSAIVLAAAVWPLKKMGANPETNPLAFSLFVTASVLVGYQEYTYDLALLFLPVLLTWNWLYRQPQDGDDRKLLLSGTMILLLGSILSLTAPSFYACAILFFFTALARQLSTVPLALRDRIEPVAANL
jgi:hypothetical protein